MFQPSRFVRREHPARRWFGNLLDNLRSRLTWVDLLVGAGAAILLALLLVGFGYRPLPQLRPGAIASEDIRAPQDFTFADQEATEQRRQAARAGVPSVYILDSRGISVLLAALGRAFEDARAEAGSERRPEVEGPQAPDEAVLFRQELLRIAPRAKLSPALQDRSLRLLDRALRDGVIRDDAWASFIGHRRAGVAVKDNAAGGVSAPSEVLAARHLREAREYLQQFHLEFAALPAAERASFLRFLQDRVYVTLQFDEAETEARRAAEASRVPPVEVRIAKGKTVIRGGEEITRAAAAQLEALKRLQAPASLLGQFTGFFFFTSILLYALWRYFVHYQTRHQRIRNHAVLVMLILVASLLVTRVASELAGLLGTRLSLGAPSLLDYAIPFAFGAMLVTLLVDTNVGILSGTILALLTGLFYMDVYLAGYAFIGSLAGIFSVRQYKDRAAIQKAGLTIGATNLVCILAIDFLRNTDLGPEGLLSRAGYGLASGLLTSGIASSLLPPLESMFRITTDIRLLELANLNAPILRRMSVETPGTYHHSIMVGTLAEAAAEVVGANPLLVRVGAFYHDLGKMAKPEYFVENQVFGLDKHESLSPSMSSLIIASHVKEGLEMAKEIGLPEKIRDLIPQHHGTRVMSYFLQKARESTDSRNGEIVEASFRYPGPKPQTREAAIMMMADSVEAASRTLDDPTPSLIQGMIERLVDAMVEDGQFEECDITLRDIARVKESFLKTLSGIYHRRIDYPGYDFNAEGRSGNGKPQARNSDLKPAKAS